MLTFMLSLPMPLILVVKVPETSAFLIYAKGSL
jgi:hypothetical protein